MKIWNCLIYNDVKVRFSKELHFKCEALFCMAYKCKYICVTVTLHYKQASWSTKYCFEYFSPFAFLDWREFLPDKEHRAGFTANFGLNSPLVFYVKCSTAINNLWSGCLPSTADTSNLPSTDMFNTMIEQHKADWIYHILNTDLILLLDCSLTVLARCLTFFLSLLLINSSAKRRRSWPALAHAGLA